jgi:hypothetical protein
MAAMVPDSMSCNCSEKPEPDRECEPEESLLKRLYRRLTDHPIRVEDPLQGLPELNPKPTPPFWVPIPLPVPGL